MKSIIKYILPAGVVLGIILLTTGCSFISNVVLPEEKVTLSFYDAPAPAITEYLTKLTDLPVSLDPAAEDITITLVTPEPVTVTDAEKLITAAFEVQNCIVTRGKNSISIRKAH